MAYLISLTKHWIFYFFLAVSLVVKESNVSLEVIVFLRDKLQCFYGNNPVWVVKVLYYEKCGDNSFKLV